MIQAVDGYGLIARVVNALARAWHEQGQGFHEDIVTALAGACDLLGIFARAKSVRELVDAAMELDDIDGLSDLKCLEIVKKNLGQLQVWSVASS